MYTGDAAPPLHGADVSSHFITGRTLVWGGGGEAAEQQVLQTHRADFILAQRWTGILIRTGDSPPGTGLGGNAGHFHFYG